LANRSDTLTLVVRTNSCIDGLGGASNTAELLNADSPDFRERLSLVAPDVVLHLATEYGRRQAGETKVLRANLLFPIEIFETVTSERRKVVFVNADSFFSKADPKNLPLAPYTRSKQQLLPWLEGMAVRTGSRVVNMRIEHVFGEDDAPDKFVPRVLSKLVANEPRIELSDGEQQRDFIYVDDVASAFVCVLDSLDHIEGPFTQFEVGRGEAVKVRTLVEQMKEQAGSGSELAFGAIGRNAGDQDHSCADTTKLRALGWQPRFPLEEAIGLCIRHERSKKSQA
jgi:nucleoside-diphosphate-sugar epimerase